MEGMGSRQSRASSRYASGPSPLQPLFCGRVRKWKKQWVTSPSSANLKRNNDAPPLLLCRWTPLSAADDPPKRRRFRYTPIVPIEKGETKSVEDEGRLESDGNGNGNGMVERGISNSKEEEEEEEAAQELNEDEADWNKIGQGKGKC